MATARKLRGEELAALCCYAKAVADKLVKVSLSALEMRICHTSFATKWWTAAFPSENLFRSDKLRDFCPLCSPERSYYVALHRIPPASDILRWLSAILQECLSLYPFLGPQIWPEGASWETAQCGQALLSTLQACPGKTKFSFSGSRNHQGKLANGRKCGNDGGSHVGVHNADRVCFHSLRFSSFWRIQASRRRMNVPAHYTKRATLPSTRTPGLFLREPVQHQWRAPQPN